MTNRLMNHEIIESYQKCSCEYFERVSRIVQCFNCYKFDHIAKSCRNDSFCHKCDKEHKSKECSKDEEYMHCSNCKKEGRKLWMRSCFRWKKAKRMANTVYQNRPYRYTKQYASNVSIAMNSRSQSSMQRQIYQVLEKRSQKPDNSPNKVDRSRKNTLIILSSSQSTSSFVQW